MKKTSALTTTGTEQLRPAGRKNYSVIQLKTGAEANAALDELKGRRLFATLAKKSLTISAAPAAAGGLGRKPPPTS
ncbi:hypothetical protein M8494_20950 [Serratia ureilytica]